MNKNTYLKLYSLENKLIRSTFSSTTEPNSLLKNPIKIYEKRHVFTRTNSVASIKPNRSFACFFKRGVGTSTTPRPYIDPTYSYMYGKSNQQLIYKNVGQLLQENVDRWPDKLVFANTTEGIERTYSQFNLDVNRTIKAMLTFLNIEKGDSVGIYSYNCYNWLVIQMACNKLGAVLTPINPSYKVDELSYILKKAKVKALFLPGPKSVQAELNNHLDVLYDQRIQDDIDSFRLESVVLMDDYDYQIENDNRLFFKQYNNINNLNLSNTRFTINHKLKKVNIMSWNYFFDNDGNLTDGNVSDIDEVTTRDVQQLDSNMGNRSNRICLFEDTAVSPDDLFAIYYTSGTTGRPKGACISQFTAVNNAISCHRRLHASNLSARVVNCLPLPMFHIFAGVLVSLTSIVSEYGTTLVFPGHRYNIKTMVDDIEKYSCTLLTCTPTMIIDLLSYVEQKGIHLPLKIVQVGGAPLLAEVFKRAFKLLPHLEDVRLGYGSTENGGVSTLQSVFEPVDTKPFTVGPPMDFTEVLIVDSKTGKPVKHGEDGEILTRGHNTMIEYLDDPEKTNEVLTKSRWYRTGDIGRLVQHGSLQIVGRIKEMIIKGGENVYPKEVEQLLLRHESIEDAHVFGVPSKRFGEEVCAWIKLKPGFAEAPVNNENSNKDSVVSKEDIIKFCRDNITYFKVPKYILFVEKFPMTPTKKAQHHVMRDESIQILGLQSEIS